MKGLIGERIFTLYEQNNNTINLVAFKSTSFRFFDSSFESKLKLVFDIFDFNNIGIISEGEIRSILSHIPLDVIVFLPLNKLEQMQKFQRNWRY